MKSFVRKIIQLPGKTGKHAWSWANDVYLGIETSDANNRLEHNPARPWPFTAKHEKARHDDSVIYGAADYLSMRRVIEKLELKPHDVVYDLGCGKGRVICLFARHQIKKTVGVELNEKHCAVARKNAGRLRQRLSPIEVRQEDAATTTIADCTILFMANPFGPDTIQDVLKNLQASLRPNPRRLRVVYYWPRYQTAFQDHPWLHPSWGMKTLRNDTIMVWENNPGQSLMRSRRK